MTKIPVDYVYEEIWKVSESKEDKKMEDDRTIRLLIWAIVALSVIAIVMAVVGICCNVSNNPEQAQCESIGGRYDGEACWYNGSKVDVNKYVEDENERVATV